MRRRSIILLKIIAYFLTVAIVGEGYASSSSLGNFQNTIDSNRAYINRSSADAIGRASELRAGGAQIVSASNYWNAALADWIQSSGLLRANKPRDALGVLAHGLLLLGSSPQDISLRAELLTTRGYAETQLGNLTQGIADFQAAYRDFRQLKQPRGQAITLHDISSQYMDAGDYLSVLRYEQQALDLYNRDPVFLLSVYSNQGISHAELGDFDLAAKAFTRALHAAEATHSSVFEARVLYNLSQAQMRLGLVAAADATIRRATVLTREGPAKRQRPAIEGAAAEVALRENRLGDAAQLIDHAFTDASGSTAVIPMIDLQRTAYAIYRRRGDNRQALAHLEAFKALSDQGRSLAASANAALMSARFDFANQDLRITRLRAGQAERDAAIARARARLHTIVTFGVLAAAIVISTLLGIGFVSIRRSRNQVRAANATLQLTNADLERALAAKTEFLATTSHEIRTPLNGILGMTQVILADRATPAPLRERVQLIHGSGETMKALVDDILDVAKMETGELRLHPAEMDLRRLLFDAAMVWNGQAETKHLTIQRDLDNCPAAIIADEVRLRQIVFNLMANAIKFTERGHVRLAAAAAVSHDDGERLLIRVSDSGVGIPAARLTDIFESFKQVDSGTTRRHGGTGLGLAICRHLARAMGGDVIVESMLGVGSTFTIDIPLERHAGAPIRTDRVSPHYLAAAEMLVVEANPLVQGILRAMLTPQLRGISFVSDSSDAEARLAAGDIDHVVADGATLGLDLAAVERLAKHTLQAGAVLSLLWPGTDPSAGAAASIAGVSQLIAKPISAPDLLVALRLVYDGDSTNRDIAA